MNNLTTRSVLDNPFTCLFYLFGFEMATIISWVKTNMLFLKISFFKFHIDF